LVLELASFRNLEFKNSLFKTDLLFLKDSRLAILSPKWTFSDLLERYWMVGRVATEISL